MASLIPSILPSLIEMSQTFPERNLAFRIRSAEPVCLSLPSYRKAVRLRGPARALIPLSEQGLLARREA
jgi:hypothetical protein